MTDTSRSTKSAATKDALTSYHARLLAAISGLQAENLVEPDIRGVRAVLRYLGIGILVLQAATGTAADVAQIAQWVHGGH